MSRNSEQMPTRVEMLKARVTRVADGFPADYRQVTAFWKQAIPAPEDGWWWIGATPASAEHARRYGHIARGTEYVTWIPQQTGVVVDPDATPDTAHPAELGFDPETGLPRERTIG